MNPTGAFKAEVPSSPEKRKGFSEVGDVVREGNRLKVFAGTCRLYAEIDNRTGNNHLVFTDLKRIEFLSSKTQFEMFRRIIEKAQEEEGGVTKIVIPSDNKQILAMNELEVIVGADAFQKAKSAFAHGEGGQAADPKKEPFVIEWKDYLDRLDTFKNLS